VKLPFELLVALRFLREGRMQTLLIVGGVTIGVAVIVFLTALITGLQSSIIARTLGSQAHVVILPPEEINVPVLDRSQEAVAAAIQKRAQRLRSIDQWEAVLRQVERSPSVLAASPMVAGPAFAIRGTASKSVALLGIEPERYENVVKIREYMIAGDFRVQGTDAVIGIELAKDLGATVGDKIRLATAENRDDVVTIAGIFDIGVKDLNRRWVFITIKLAQNLLDLAGGVSNIDLRVDRLFEAERIANLMEAQTGLKVESWMQTNPQLLAALRNQTITNGLIRGFVILIVALGIASVLVVSVVQKQREIGILRAMGTSPRRIMTIFLLQGGMVALAGSIAGSPLAALLVRLFSTIYRTGDGKPLFAPEVDPMLFLTAWGVAAAVGVIAAVIPARRAAHLDPVVAIRYG
jgi:lipoprotein-releasing system permease protein